MSEEKPKCRCPKAAATCDIYSDGEGEGEGVSARDSESAEKKRVVSKTFISDSDEELSSEREDTTQSDREGETGEQSEVPQMMGSQSGQSEDEG